MKYLIAFFVLGFLFLVLFTLRIRAERERVEKRRRDAEQAARERRYQSELKKIAERKR